MKNGLRFVDSDGHIFEHPAGMVPDLAGYAPAAWRQRIQQNWGGAGLLEDRPAESAGARLADPMLRPGGHQVGPRLEDMDSEGIDVSVLYPTLFLGIQNEPDVEFADVQCRAYNDWLSDHACDSGGRLWGAAVVAQQDIDRAAREIRRAAKLPGMKAAFIRPNPTEDWKPFNHPVYAPLWEAACDTGLPLGLHPFLAADLPGACVGLRLNEAADTTTQALEARDTEITAGSQRSVTSNIYFTQAIANPFDMMNSMTFLLAGGVCERYPDLKLIFLESNGGWIVPWLERLDHHYEVFDWDVPLLKMEPSEYFRRQCWISFDTDESTLAFTANSPLVGAERIIWASDYPHPDAKIPGVTDELVKAIIGLTPDQQAQIAGLSAVTLYDL
jgi:predicted TIM-barrel fold metal-dependent hydrolase